MEDGFSEFEMAKKELLKSILDTEIGKCLIYVVKKINKLLQQYN